MSFVLHSCFHYFLSPFQMHRLQIVFSYTSRWLLPSLTQQAHQTHTHTVFPFFSCLSVLCFWHPYYTPSHLNDDKTFALIPKDTLRTCTHCSVYVSVCAVYVRAWVGRPVGSCVELTHTDTHFWHMTMRALFSG